jgi:hypothetical protein
MDGIFNDAITLALDMEGNDMASRILPMFSFKIRNVRRDLGQHSQPSCIMSG